MSLSKSITSAVAALTVAGAVGLAYAQSTPDTATQPAPATADTSQPASNTAPPADTSTMPSSSTAAPSNNVSSGSSTDLAPKADRN